MTFRQPKVVKHCPEGHAMEMTWRTCPKCTGRKSRDEVKGRDMTEQTIIFGAPPVSRSVAAATAPAPPSWVALLEGTNGPVTGRAFEIQPGRWKLGRAPREEPGMQLMVVGDPGMSRDHFALEAGVAAVILRDVGSTNGTFINGQRIERHILTDGDLLRAGESTFVVRLALRATSA